MLYSKVNLDINEHVIVQVHTPRTGGTTLRSQLNEMLGIDVCLMNYRAEIEYLNDVELKNYQQISGHFSYGLHQYFSKKALYITTVRDPVARFISLYSVIRARPDHRLHHIAKQFDINEFLRISLNGSDPELKQQVANLQCQFVCGSANFALARKYIDDRYFLACALDQIELMMRMLSATFNLPAPVMKSKGIKTQATPNGNEAINCLTNESIATLLESNNHDLQLFHYVQREFEAIQQSNSLSHDKMQVQLPLDRTSTRNLENSSDATAVQLTSKIQRLMSNASNRFLECLPTALVKQMRCLWVGPPVLITPLMGVELKVAPDISEFLGESTTQDVFDCIFVAFPFEAVIDDTLLFDNLFARLSPVGIIQICCLSETGFPDWHKEYDGFSAIRSYKNGIHTHFKIAEKRLMTLEFSEKFPLYGSRCKSYVFFKNNDYLPMIQTCLSSLRKTLSVAIY